MIRYRVRDLKDIRYRETTIQTDAHGVKHRVFGEALDSLKCTIQPQTLTQEVKDVGLVTTGDYVLFVPLDIQNVSIKQGDGFYIDSIDYDVDPQWIVSNTPYHYPNHTILVLKNKLVNVNASND